MRSKGENHLAEAEPRQHESDGKGKSFSKSLQVDSPLLLAEAAVDQCDSYFEDVPGFFPSFKFSQGKQNLLSSLVGLRTPTNK